MVDRTVDEPTKKPRADLHSSVISARLLQGNFESLPFTGHNDLMTRSTIEACPFLPGMTEGGEGMSIAVDKRR